MMASSATTLLDPTNRKPLGVIDANKAPKCVRSKAKLPLHRPKVQPEPELSTKEKFDLIWQEKKGKFSRDDFQFISELGSGGSATVYCANEKTSGYKVALKVQKATEDAHCEIDLHEALYHPNIVNMIDSFYSAEPFGPAQANFDESSLPYAASDDNYLYSILEICDEGSLSDIIDGCGSGVSEKAAASYFKDMIEAVEYLHGQDIIHCDIKPANFLVHESQVKLADFGMAIPSDVKMVVGGSVSYMSPEYLMAWRKDGENFDHRVDIYSLGVVLFEMLFGYLPYDVIEDDSSPLLDIISDEESSESTLIAGMNNLSIDSEEDEDGKFPTLDLRMLNDLESDEPFEAPRPIFIEEMSEEAQDLIECLMEPNAENRISIREAKQHSWFKRFK